MTFKEKKIYLKYIMTKKNKAEELSDTTLIQYDSTIKSLARRINVDPTISKNWMGKNFNKLIDEIENGKNPKTGNPYSIKTIRNYYVVLCSLGGVYGMNEEQLSKCKERMDKLNEEILKFQGTHEMTEKEETSWVSSAEIAEKIKVLKNKLPTVGAIDIYREYKQLMQYLSLLFLSHHSLRNDLAQTKIFTNDEAPEKYEDDINYFIINKETKNGVFILNRSKTSSYYGSKEYDIDDEVTSEFFKYYKVIKTFSPENYLMADRDNNKKPITRNVFTKWMQSIWESDGKKISTSMIRKIITSEKYQLTDAEIKKRNEEKLLAEQQGHSQETAYKFYAKKIPASKKK